MTDSVANSSSSTLPESSRERSQSTSWTQLPVECLEHIFEHLTGIQLLNARLICRRWRDVITGCPSLVSRFKVTIEVPEGVECKMNEAYHPEGLPVGVTEVEIKGFDIENVGVWWSHFGKYVVKLTVSVTLLPTSILWDLLRQTPNLKCLCLNKLWLTGAAEPNFQLGKLEKLSIDFVRYITKEFTDLRSVLTQVFPRLKDLRYRGSGYSQDDFVCHRSPGNVNIGQLLQSIRTLQETLEGFDVDDEANILPQLAEMDRLQLKRVSVNVNSSFDMNCWANFLRAHPLIDDLAINAENLGRSRVLRNIAETVPKLKQLTLEIFSGTSTDFMDLLTDLEYLKIEGMSFLDLSNRTNAHLKELHLHMSSVTGFMKYLEQCTHLRYVSLHRCSLRDETSSGEPIINLRSLDIDMCAAISASMVEALLKKCSRLETLQLTWMHQISDDVVLMACERLKYLRKLYLNGSQSITATSIDHIIRHGRTLEALRLCNYNKGILTEETREELEIKRNVRISFAKNMTSISIPIDETVTVDTSNRNSAMRTIRFNVANSDDSDDNST